MAAAAATAAVEVVLEVVVALTVATAVLLDMEVEAATALHPSTLVAGML